MFFPAAGFSQDAPRIIGWEDDFHYLVRKSAENDESVVVKVHVKTGEETLLPGYKTDREMLEEYLPEGFTISFTDDVSSDNRKTAISMDNDLYFFDTGMDEPVRITEHEAREMNPRFSPCSRRIAYTRERDLYVYDLEDMKEIRLTFDAGDKIYNGWASWVYFEEILGRGSRYAAFWWAPDGSKLAYLRTDDRPVPEFTLVGLDVEDGVNGRPEITPYPKAGDPNPIVKMGIAHIESGETVWVPTDETVDQYIAWPFWTPDSKKLAVQVLNRGQDDMRFILADASTGDFREIYRETTSTWLNFFKDIHVMENGDGFLLRSHKTGWENLYHYDWDGNLKAQITDFDWRVQGISRVDEETGDLYFYGTGKNPLERHFYRVGLDGDRLQQITPEPGTHSLSISPGAVHLIDTWSSIDNPGTIVAKDAEGSSVREIFRAEIPEYDPATHQKTEIVKITTSDGEFDMPAHITYPLNFDETKKYPVVFTIYGGPNSARTRNTWRSPNPSWYGQHGIVTISVDHRGSGHFGRRGLDYMHRNLGIWETRDYIDAVKWLRGKPWADPERIGITGGSYGGYVTIMALTKGAEYFTHGVARASVTDWRLYDNIYTERYMDRPQDNPEGYEKGSTLTYAADFRGRLQIVHGDMDDNVHMQNSIQLISRLQDLGKEFEFMIYPGGRHSWGGAKRAHSNNMANSFWLREFFGE